MPPTRTLPMFPLGSVLFPYALLPLHVFEPRYRVMMRRCLDADREFGVVLIERGSEVGGGDVRFDVGTVARIVQANELPDGRWAVVAVGVRRLHVERWLADDPYPRAEIVEIDEPSASTADAAHRTRAVDTLREVVELWRQVEPGVPVTLPEFDDDPARCAFEIAAVAPLGPLDAYGILAATGTAARLEALTTQLRERADELRARLALE